jgi:hypothetical protein
MCRRLPPLARGPAPLRGGGIKPTAMPLRSRGIRGRGQLPPTPSSAPEGGGGTVEVRRDAPRQFRRPLRGLGKDRDGGGPPPRTHGSQGIAVGFIPPPHTGLGRLLDCGVSANVLFHPAVLGWIRGHLGGGRGSVRWAVPTRSVGTSSSSRREASASRWRLLQAPACSSLGLGAGAGPAAEREAGASGKSVAKQELRDEERRRGTRSVQDTASRR